MATTITRSHWTNDSGTPGAPVGDGTQINEAELQKIYANIDSLIANNISFGGLVAAEGFGTHDFSAGGSGNNVIRIRNTSSGTTNSAQVQFDNNLGNVGAVLATSSTWTTSNELVQNSLVVRSVRPGGISIAAMDGAGTIRHWAQGALVGTWDATNCEIDSTNVIIKNSAGAAILTYNSAGTSNNKAYRLVNFTSTLSLQLMSDDLLTAVDVMNVNRSGTTVSSIVFSGPVFPGTDNTRDFGATSLRWANGYFTNVISGDLSFENAWAWTESYKVGNNLPDGIALVTADGQVVALLTNDGLHVGHVRHDLYTYDLRVTTADERRAIKRG